MESSRRATANLLVWGCQAKARMVQPALEGGTGQGEAPQLPHRRFGLKAAVMGSWALGMTTQQPPPKANKGSSQSHQ